MEIGQTKGQSWSLVMAPLCFCNLFLWHSAEQVWRIYCRSTSLITGQHPTDNCDIPILCRCLSHIMKNAKDLCKKQYVLFECECFIIHFEMKLITIIIAVFLEFRNTTSWRCTYLGSSHVLQLWQTWKRWLLVQQSCFVVLAQESMLLSTTTTSKCLCNKGGPLMWMKKTSSLKTTW